jgi:transcriptional regulator with XRE-family HTH domain
VSRSRAITAEERQRLKFTPEFIGKMVRTRRLALGLSMSEMGRRIGIDARTVSHWENGEIDATSVRMFNFVLAGTEDSIRDSWMRRALRAEGAIKDISSLIGEYRGLELSNGRG